MSPFFSVIIPVFNVEKYLPECASSVLEQSEDDFEVILVDDGSADGSGQICDGYAARDNRVHVIHKENGGLSSARNAGLDAASGEYVIFLDGDDYFGGSDALAKLRRICEEKPCDFLLFKSLSYYSDREKFTDRYGDYDISVFEKEDNIGIFKYMISSGKQVACAWNKVVRREFLLNLGLYFEEGVIAEDAEWNVRLFCGAGNIRACNDPVHIYRRGRENSITSKSSERHVGDLVHIMERIISFADGLSERAADAVYSFAAFEYAVLLYNIAATGEYEKYSGVKSMAFVLKYASDKKSRLTAAAYRILGYKNTVKLLGRKIR